MDFRDRLSREEREEYDELLYDAGYDEFHRKRPSSEVADRLHDLLVDALQAQRQWARYVIDDDARAGHLSRFKRWDRQRQVVHTRHNDVIIKRSAVMAVRRRDAETGHEVWQDVFWKEMGRDELMQVIAGCSTRIASEQITVESARRLLRLLDETNAETVDAALATRGVTLDEFLTAETG